MVAVVEPHRLAEVEAVLDKWELHHAVIGSVTDSGELRCFCRGDLEGAIPASFLTDECPRYQIEQEPQPPRAGRPANAANKKSKAWIYEQYDQLVQSRTVRRPGLDGAVVRLLPGHRGLAVSLDGPRIGELDPFAAGAGAVLGAARNVACAGGEPLALTDCLNFGNPEKPEIGWELAQAIEGIAQAAEALEIPVVSGNVSLYNETDGQAIPPTPVVGCVGLVANVRKIRSRWRTGDAVLVVEAGESLAEQAALIEFLWRSVPFLSLAHDVSNGGLDRTIAEAAAWSGAPAEVDQPADTSAAAAVLAVSPDQVPALGWERLVQIGEVA
jgi:phosphoribosylformylglycinamidine (FGAM) synthase-like enzyme